MTKTLSHFILVGIVVCMQLIEPNAQQDWRVRIENDAYLTEVMSIVTAWEREAARQLTDGARNEIIDLVSERRSRVPVNEWTRALRRLLDSIQANAESRSLIDRMAIVDAWGCPPFGWPFCD